MLLYFSYYIQVFMIFQPQIVQINKYFLLLLKPSYIHIHISQAKDQLLSP